jgi:hypothetical protein
MKKRTITKSGLFIIESLKFEDEKDGFYEGEVISKILNFARIKHSYYYIRTRAELEEMIQIFNDSNYRYLHISCHGNTDAIYTTLDKISFNDLSLILENSLDKKRLFLSACSATNQALANKIFTTTECFSIIGPNKSIYMEDAAIFWASFYQLMFKINSNGMVYDDIYKVLTKLIDIHEVPMKFFRSSRETEIGYKEVKL